MDIPILMYHHITARQHVDPTAYEISLGHFEQQLDLLRKSRFRTMHFDELFTKLDGSSPKVGRAVIVTFDDGFRSFLTLALPALRNRGMTATVFVPAGYIGATNRWDEARGFPSRTIMTAEELRQIVDSGMEIGSHGWRHRNLKLSSESEINEEVNRSKMILEEVIERQIETFAYPYGEYCANNFRQLQNAGYRGAVSIFSAEPTVTHNPYAMRRVYVHENDVPWRLRCKLSPAYLRLLAWRGKPQELHSATS